MATNFDETDLLEMFNYLHDAITDLSEDLEWSNEFTKGFDKIYNKMESMILTDEIVEE